MENIRNFLDFCRDGAAAYVFEDTGRAIKEYQEHLEAEIAKEISEPIITTNDLTPFLPNGVDTLVIDITHQVRINGVDFSLGYVDKNGSVEWFDLDDIIIDRIYDRIHEPITSDCEIPGGLENKYLSSLFDQEAKDIFVFKGVTKWNKQETYDLDINKDTYNCNEGTDS